jgi:hypothetical protein
MAIQRGAYNQTGSSTGILAASRPMGIQSGPYNNTNKKEDKVVNKVAEAADAATVDFNFVPPMGTPEPLSPEAPPPLVTPPPLSPPPPTAPASPAEPNKRKELAYQLKEFAQTPSSSPETATSLMSGATKIGVTRNQMSRLYRQYAAGLPK